jgi:2-polyprenyl-3-methyl-5-hydroxy-6-metoxy-1,4-benzoquinol methylase
MPGAEELAAIYDGGYYDELYPEHQFAEQKRLFANRLSWLEPMAGGGRLRILEVGSGRGVFLEAALERGHDVTGQDLSEAAVAAIRARHGVQAERGALEELRLPGASYDLVHMNHVLEHIPDPGRVLREIRRLLKPGGVLYVEVPRQSNLLNRLSGLMAGKQFGFTYHPGHLYLFSPASLKRLLTAGGLPPALMRIEGMAAPHRFVRGVHYHGALAHLIKTVAGGLRMERWLGGGNLVAAAIKPKSEARP